MTKPRSVGPEFICYKCDVCDVDLHGVFFYHYENDSPDSLDFCENCFDKLEDHMNISRVQYVGESDVCDICVRRTSNVTHAISFDNGHAVLLVCRVCNVSDIKSVFSRFFSWDLNNNESSLS